MKKAIMVIALSTLFAGCSNFENYIENRTQDFAQIFRFTLGIGIGASIEAQIGPLRPTLGAAVYGEAGYIYGRWKNSLAFEPYYDTNSNLGLGLFSSEGFQSVVRRRDGQSRKYDQRFCTIPYKFTPHSAWSHHEKSWLRYTDIEIGATIGVIRASLGFSVGEFFDFLLGWFGIDIAGDDKKPPGTVSG